MPLEAPEGARGGWMRFIRVADVDACVEEAVGLGSQVLVEPGTVNDDAGRIAVITDTHGGVIGLIQKKTEEPFYEDPDFANILPEVTRPSEVCPVFTKRL